MIAPAYDLRAAKLADVRPLFVAHHGYRSTGNSATYCFAVYEDDAPVAAFVWQPPPPGAAHSVCPTCPAGVLSLSRMVAVPREQRATRLRNPLRRQMRALIDRTRWPVLVTYSDEGQGHTGYIYQITGWQKVGEPRRAPTITTADGRRVSRYANGRAVDAPDDAVLGTTLIQRWQHHVGPDAAATLARCWDRVEVPGKRWRSGAQAYTYVRRAAP